MSNPTRAVAPSGDPGPADLREMLGLAFDLSTASLILVDENLKIICANPAACGLLAVDDLTGHFLTEFNSPQSSGPAVRASGERFGDGGVRDDRDVEMVSATGKTLHVRLQVDPVVMPDGQRFALRQLQDNTADQSQRDDLLTNHHVYREMFENLPDSSVIVFDRHLRLTLAVGEVLRNARYTKDLTGMLMRDAFPTASMDILEGRLLDTLAGQASDFAYLSPALGRRFRIRLRPVTDQDGAVVGGMSLVEDVSDEHARRAQLQQIHHLGQVGSCWYDTRTGWTFDETLLDLWGFDSAADVPSLPDLVIAEDRAKASRVWETLSSKGRHSHSYRMLHGQTGELRHLQSTYEATTDASGTIIQAIASHIDVTAAVLAHEVAEGARAAAVESRILLLRQVGTALVTSHSGPDELMNSVTALAAAAIGDGAVIRILTPDQQRVEQDLIAHPDEDIRRRFKATVLRSADNFDPKRGIAAQVVGKGELVSVTRERSWEPEFRSEFGDRGFEDAEHFMVAPVRHDGKVLGLLAVFRSDRGNPYRLGEDDVLQVLADGAGTAIAEARFRRALENERDNRLDELTARQRDMLEKLAGMETRERSMLAESIHDEPIQRIVAGMMSIDVLRGRVDAAASSELDRIANELEIAVDWLRNLVVVALSPPDLTDGIGPALGSLALGIFTGTATKFSTQGPDHVHLDLATKEAAYRILREALVNIRKHANAGDVILRLVESRTKVVMSLIDNGVGSDNLDSGEGHFGMAVMHARADAEGGHLTINRVPGLGTTVTLTMPTGTLTPA